MTSRIASGLTLAAAVSVVALGALDVLPDGKSEDDVALALALGATDEELTASFGISKSEARSSSRVAWSESVVVVADEAVAAEANAEIAQVVCSFLDGSARCLAEQAESLSGPFCPDGRRVYATRFQATPKLAAALSELKLSAVTASGAAPLEECK